MTRGWLNMFLASVAAMTFAVSSNLAKEPPAAPAAEQSPPKTDAAPAAPKPPAPKKADAPPAAPKPPAPKKADAPKPPKPPEQADAPKSKPPKPAPQSPRPQPDNHEVKIFALHHARAGDMERIVSDLIGGAVRTSTDDRSNSLLVRGAAADLDIIEAMLVQLDKPLSKPKAEPDAQSGNDEPATAIRNAARGAAAVTWLAADKTRVKKGDLLMKLDAGDLESELGRAEVEYAHLAAQRKSLDVELKQRESEIAAERERAELELQQAKIALESFLGGEKILMTRKLESEIALAQEALALAQTDVASPERAFQIKKAENALKVGKLAMHVFEKFTAPKEIAALETEIQITAREAERLKSQHAAIAQGNTAERQALDREQQQLAEQIERLKGDLKNYGLKAPREGVVHRILPVVEGAVVRQGQTVLLLGPAESKP